MITERLTERGIKVLKSSLLLTEYQKRQLELLEKKKIELELKRKENEEILHRNKQFLEEKELIKQEKNVLQHTLANNYEENMRSKEELKKIKVIVYLF